jgi:hypothetical protein
MADGPGVVTSVALKPEEEIKFKGSGVIAYNHGGSILYLATTRDVWPIRQIFEQESSRKDADGQQVSQLQLISSTELEIEKVNERWVPKNAMVRGPNDTFAIDFNWKKLNHPVNEIDTSFQRARDLALELSFLKVQSSSIFRKGE